MALRKLSGKNLPKLKFPRQRALKLRFRRKLRLQKRQVEELGAQAEQRLENDFFRRLERLGQVRRFVTSWLLLVILLTGVVAAQNRNLSSHYQVLAPVPGGTYTEGVLGTFTNANPIYATDPVDASVSKLLFAGLLTYDQNNRLTVDLAESWAVDKAGTTFTVKLKPGLVWHDGQRLTANDVLFTYGVIQNPDARSPFFNSWRDIKVTAPDDTTVIFELPNPLASFPYFLTNGIVPEHILGEVAMTDMRSVSFNSTQPVGAGPFKWQAIELTGGPADKRQESIGLTAFDGYHAGKPKLNGFVIKTFREPEQLVESFQNQELTGIAGLSNVPDTLRGDSTLRAYNLPLTAAVMTFFRTQEGVLANAKVRQALIAAADTDGIMSSLPYPTQPVKQALLHGQFAYDPKYNQAPYDPSAAVRLLEQDGWAAGAGGLRSKDKTPLSFSLFFLNSPEYASVARQLAEDWRRVGVTARLVPQNEDDLREVLSNAPSPGATSYDALLYGISIGVDPDVYVYWHSSQIDLRSSSRLNFSQYKSAAADAALEAGRTRLDQELRAVKYQPFLKTWQTDAPALGLYQPRLLYVTRGEVSGLAESPVNAAANRLDNVHNWMIRKEWVTP